MYVVHQMWGNYSFKVFESSDEYECVQFIEHEVEETLREMEKEEEIEDYEAEYQNQASYYSIEKVSDI